MYTALLFITQLQNLKFYKIFFLLASSLLDYRELSVVLAIVCFILIIVLTVLIIPLYKLIKQNKRYDTPKFTEVINKGQYTQLRIGSIKDVPRLIKLFNRKEDWQRETDLLPFLDSSFDGILQLNDSTRCFYNGSLVHCLIGNSFSVNGSLRDFLQANKLSLEHLKSLSLSATNSLAFLHEQITTIRGDKYTIAHRLINSNSFIISDNMTCILSNLECALLLDEKNEVDCNDSYTRVYSTRTCTCTVYIICDY